MKRPQRLTVSNIYTDRFRPDYREPFRHVIYEWEDQISATADIPITSSQVFRRLHAGFIKRSLLKIPGAVSVAKVCNSLLGRESKSLYFVLSPQGKGSFSTRSDVIPVLIDFWKTVDLRTFYRNYSMCPLVLVSSLEAFNFLRSRDCPLDIHHFPLSLPDRYRIAADDSFEKKYDILVAGRPNPLLMEYMRRYAQEHPSIEYLYQSGVKGEHVYVSNRTGVVGAFEERPDYMNLLRAARVGFYSTPGIDGGEGRTGGFNPVTPRLLELLSAGCHVLARYPDNDDTEFYRLGDICPSIDSYEAFVARLEASLQSPPPVRRNSEYLEQHYTSTRGALLQQIMLNYK